MPISYATRVNLLELLDQIEERRQQLESVLVVAAVRADRAVGATTRDELDTIKAAVQRLRGKVERSPLTVD